MLLSHFTKLISALFLIAAISAPSLADEEMGKQKALSFKPSGPRAKELNYLLHIPESKNSEKIPVLLFLHGAGERGSDVKKVAVHGPPKLIKQGKNLPFIVISPQCPEDSIWKPGVLLQLVANIIKEHNGDPERVYLTGLSMGGFGSWDLAVNHPERFAAVAPICGGGNIIGILLAPTKKSDPLKSLPIWAFHGAKDEVVKLNESERMVDAFKRRGNKTVKLTIYPDAGHDSWTAAYNSQELYDWMLQHKRPEAAALWKKK